MPLHQYETEAVEPREYRVWLAAEQARPMQGVSYDHVPTHPLQREAPTAEGADRWARKVQRTDPGKDDRAHRLVVHVWDCPEAPADASELDVFGAPCQSAVAAECPMDSQVAAAAEQDHRLLVVLQFQWRGSWDRRSAGRDCQVAYAPFPRAGTRRSAGR
jgi:hypothetical protein